MYELLELASAEYDAVGEMGVGNGSSTNQCMIYVNAGRTQQILVGFVGDDPTQLSFRRNRNGGIRMSVPRE